MIRLAWMVVTLALIGQAGVTLTMQGLAIIYPFIQEDFGLSTAQIGFITSLFFTGGLVTMFVGGWLSDRFGVKRVMVLILVLGSISTYAISTVFSFHGLLVIVFLAGMSIGPGYPATSRAVINRVPVSNLGLAMSVKQTGTALAGALSAILMPTIAVSLGWRSAATVMAAVILLIGVAFLLFYPGNRQDKSSSSSGSLRDSLVTLKRNRSLQVVVVWGLSSTAGQIILLTHFMLFLIEELSIEPVVAGSYFAITNVTSVVIRVLWGGTSDYFLRGRQVIALTIMGGLMIIGFALVSTLSADSGVYAFTVISVVLGASVLSWQGIFTALVGQLGRRGQAGGIIGLVGTTMRFSQIIMPPLFGLLVDVTESYVLVWLILAAMPLVTTLVLFKFCEEPGHV